MYVLINVEQLAKDMADDEFKERVEPFHAYTDIYEQVDESEQWYMKASFAKHYDYMKKTYVDFLLGYAHQDTKIPSHDTGEEKDRTGA